MRKLIAAVAVLGAVSLVAGVAFAQAGGGRGGAGEKLDANGDGKISRQEWRGNEEAFDRLDTDGDGYLVIDEVLGRRGRTGPEAGADVQQMRERMRQRRMEAFEQRRPGGQQAGEQLRERRREQTEERLEERLERLRGEGGPEQMEGRGMMRGRGMMQPGETGRGMMRGEGRMGEELQPATQQEGFAVGLFRRIDRDDDRRMSIEEIRTFALQLTEADADRDGYVTAAEARDALRETASAEPGWRFIERHDADGDRQVTRQEFRGADAAFQRLDANNDGVITTDDFEAQPGQGRGEGGQRRGMGGQSGGGGHGGCGVEEASS